MLAILRRIFGPRVAHCAERLSVGDGRTLLVLRFTGSVDRTRDADLFGRVLTDARRETVDGLVLDFRELAYAWGNNSADCALFNALGGEMRFIRVIPGPRCRSGFGVFIAAAPRLVADAVEAAVEQFAAR